MGLHKIGNGPQNDHNGVGFYYTGVRCSQSNTVVVVDAFFRCVRWAGTFARGSRQTVRNA